VTIEVTFHPEAVRELRAAFLWYFDRNPIVAQSFEAEIDHAMEMIVEDPSRWPKWSDSERKYVFPRFPFNLIYRFKKGIVEVIAVAHQKRKPGYWKKR
jgi:plasmid stabilization system protein ParE